jgi:hypothetical protein
MYSDQLLGKRCTVPSVLQETSFAVHYEWTCDMTDDMRKAKMLQVMHVSEFVNM